jgi:hypothetical protein
MEWMAVPWWAHLLSTHWLTPFRFSDCFRLLCAVALIPSVFESTSDISFDLQAFWNVECLIRSYNSIQRQKNRHSAMAFESQIVQSKTMGSSSEPRVGGDDEGRGNGRCPAADAAAAAAAIIGGMVGKLNRMPERLDVDAAIGDDAETAAAPADDDDGEVAAPFALGVAVSG